MRTLEPYPKNPRIARNVPTARGTWGWQDRAPDRSDDRSTILRRADLRRRPAQSEKPHTTSAMPSGAVFSCAHIGTGHLCIPNNPSVEIHVQKAQLAGGGLHPDHARPVGSKRTWASRRGKTVSFDLRFPDAKRGRGSCLSILFVTLGKKAGPYRKPAATGLASNRLNGLRRY